MTRARFWRAHRRAALPNWHSATARRGLSPATYQNEAEKGDRRSGIAMAELAEGLTPPPVHLVFEDRWALHGTVLAASGPVPQAQVFGFPVTTERSLAALSLPSTRSGVDGGFVLSLPDSTELVRLVVMAPGNAFHVSALDRRTFPSQDTIELQLQSAGGTLELGPATGFGYGHDRRAARARRVPHPVGLSQRRHDTDPE